MSKRLTIILLAVPTLLFIPLIGMQFSSKIDWSPLDFAVMGVLLLGTGIMLEIILRKFKGKASRMAFIAIIAVIFLLIWAELAVGIFGTPLAGN